MNNTTTEEIYLLYLLWFNDPNVVLEEDELKDIEKEIGECIASYSTGEKYEGPWKVYKLGEEFIQKIIKNKSSESLTIKSVRMGYYHYRIIFEIISNFKEKFRDLREEINKLKENCDKEVLEVIEKVSTKLEGKIRPEAKIVGYCSYPLIIRKGKPEGKFPFSDDTSSMSFNIFEVAWPWKLNWWPWRWHIVRISKPRMVVYTGGMSDKLKRDIINAIYQHGLYEMKEKQEKIIDEGLLIQLWDHMMDTLARTRSEVYLGWLTFILIILTAILISPFLYEIIRFLIKILFP
jgi:hypothetical protein